MPGISRILLGVVFAFAIAGCDSAMAPEYLSDANPAKLKGKKWEWVGYTTLDGYKTDIPAGSYFAVHQDTVIGNSGGNAFRGICTVAPSQVSITSLTYACSANSGKDFMAWLESSQATYRQRDSLLVVIPAQGDMLHLFFKQQ
jgi:hypothetical protein